MPNVLCTLHGRLFDVGNDLAKHQYEWDFGFWAKDSLKRRDVRLVLYYAHLLLYFFMLPMEELPGFREMAGKFSN